MVSDLDTWFRSYGIWLFFIALAFETVFFTSLIVPGLLVVLFGGYYAGIGRLPLEVPVILCVAGLWTGDIASYTTGRYLWGGIARRFASVERNIERVRPVLLQRSSVFFVVYHFEPVSRAVGSLAAGIVRVPVRRWLPFDFIGGALWVGLYSAIGWGLGSLGRDFGDWNQIAPIQLIALVAIVAWLLLIAIIVRRSLRVPNHPEGT